MRSARMEVSDRISAAPASAAASLPPPPGPPLAATLDASAFVALSLDALAERAATGAPEAAAAAALLAEAPRSGIGAVTARLAEAAKAAGGGSSSAWSPEALYRLALDADGAGRQDEAIVILCVLAGTGRGEIDGCLGLAVIAARMKRFDEAMTLATRCLDAEARHPRALCIVGICELERGDVAGAQTYLAAAARIARANPVFREDLQAAQRALLLMHLSQS